MMNKDKIILASASPRRIDIMKRHGFDPIIMPASVDETLPENISLEAAIMYLALKKGLYIEEKILNTRPDLKGYTIISADTIVYKDGIMGKPVNRDHAFEMLNKIKNTNHYVGTGVSIIVAGENIKRVFYQITKVFCKDYSHSQINQYLDTDEPYDKAGAYAIQGIFSKYIDHYEGDYDNVVGFPWEKISQELDNLSLLG